MIRSRYNLVHALAATAVLMFVIFAQGFTTFWKQFIHGINLDLNPTALLQTFALTAALFGTLCLVLWLSTLFTKNAPNDLNNPNDLNAPMDLKDTARRILVAGNRSGGVAVAAMRRWPEAEVIAHAFDYHHARAIRKRLLDESLPARNVRCSAGVGTVGTDPLPSVGTDPMPSATAECRPFDAAFFMTTPQSMPAELVLDQLQDIHLNLAEGGARAVKRGAPVKTRDFAATWEASVPGGEPLTFTTYPGCFCHRRPDAGGLALAEVAAREVKGESRKVKGEGGKVKGEGGKGNDEEEGKTPFTFHPSPFTILDMGCGCGLVGLLILLL